MLEKIPKYVVDSQENKLMYHRTNQLGVLTYGTNDNAQIILFRIHYAKTQFFGKSSKVGKGGRKKREMMISSKVDRLIYSGDECTVGDLKG